VPQAAEVPHLHAPPLQLSAVVALQAVQAAPVVPHVAVVGGDTHVVPLQQPAGQLVALHTHAPPTHRWPAAHMALAPQRHAPPLQVSARVVSHVVQAAPPEPHWVTEGVAQVLPLQQPLAHDAAEHPSHAWLVHVAAHVAHDAPRRPHCAAVVPA
jgi:hypothetical protein